MVLSFQKKSRSGALLDIEFHLVEREGDYFLSSAYSPSSHQLLKVKGRTDMIDRQTQ